MWYQFVETIDPCLQITSKTQLVAELFLHSNASYFILAVLFVY